MLTGIAAYALVIVVQLIVFVPLATGRGFDGDEGFYAIAAKLVAHGHQPYFDFWLQYTPGLPYVYGAWSRVAGESFQDLRNLSVVLSVALGVGLYAHVAKRFSRRLGLIAVLLYASSSLVFVWYSTYKSYALSTLLLFVAYACASPSDRDEDCSGARWFAAGLFLGLSIDVRLYFVVVAPVLAYYAMGRSGPLVSRLGRVPVLLGGLVVGLLPSLYFFARDPRRFISDTLLSHSARSDLSPLDSVVQKLRVAGDLLNAAQFLVLVAAAVALVIVVVSTRRRLPLAIAIAGAVALASVIP
jgi:4-amino-4-deoxy-L-arabinose transferase-like glycosyltransferase